MFKFDLDPVLEHRRHLEQEAQRDVAQAQERVQAVIREIEGVREARRQTLANWRERVDLGISMEAQRLHDEWRADLRRQETLLIERGQRAQQVLNEKRAVLAKAHHEVEKFEHLRKEALKEYLEALEKREQRFLDDMMVMRHGRATPMKAALEATR